ncbi:hypothetical protein KIPB_013405 [Kipferlia bialata]|uniref:Uncharacterized protein n=1 Tax=Kipferlia bialata TaxID=797122 RepID=A0A9K3GQ81_9EUKA|nr:hypothetical protein KIPB_013405 [Kipferlia bialata]|eukprot:g13405.t1
MRGGQCLDAVSDLVGSIVSTQRDASGSGEGGEWWRETPEQREERETGRERVERRAWSVLLNLEGERGREGAGFQMHPRDRLRVRECNDRLQDMLSLSLALSERKRSLSTPPVLDPLSMPLCASFSPYPTAPTPPLATLTEKVAELRERETEGESEVHADASERVLLVLLALRTCKEEEKRKEGERERRCGEGKRTQTVTPGAASSCRERENEGPVVPDARPPVSPPPLPLSYTTVLRSVWTTLGVPLQALRERLHSLLGECNTHPTPLLTACHDHLFQRVLDIQRE